MDISEQYHMYGLVHYLIHQEQYDVLQFNYKTNEIWLKKYENKKTNIVRIAHKGFDWKNHLQADIRKVFGHVHAMQKMLAGKTIEIYNIYFTAHTPVDTWESLKKPMIIRNRKPLMMKTFYITNINNDEESERLEKVTSFKLPNKLTTLPAEVSQAQAIQLVKKDVLLQMDKQKREMQSLFSFGKSTFTKLFILLSMVMFVVLEVNGGSTNIDTLVQFGAKFNPALLEGEWWRLISSMFLHIGIFHLIMNMYALYFLGDAVERMYGSVRFFIIYFIAGMMGALTSFALNDSVSAGASGAIFGLFGALIFFGINYKEYFWQMAGKNILLILLLNLALGVMIPQIDMGAHMGGLLGGFFAAMLTNVPKKRFTSFQLLALLLIFTMVGLLLYIGII